MTVDDAAQKLKKLYNKAKAENNGMINAYLTLFGVAFGNEIEGYTISQIVKKSKIKKDNSRNSVAPEIGIGRNLKDLVALTPEGKKIIASLDE